MATRAATLYFDPGDGEIGPGGSLPLEIKIDIDGNCINTVEAEIIFPQGYLSIADFLVGESLLSFWVDRPDDEAISTANKTGSLHFAGGIPGGYCGKIPGDPGLSNIVGRIIFVMSSLIVSDVKRDSLEIGFSDATRVLLNDGQGTEDKLTAKSAVFAVSDTPRPPDRGWEAEIKQDLIPPEPFMIELQSNAGIYNGRYYINFHTQDKQSGLDRYEVLEIRPEEEIGVKPETGLLEQILGHERPAPAWKTAEIPYLLEDQSLLSIIRVRAVDKAGNERMAEYIPPESLRTEEAATVVFTPVIMLVALSLVGLILLIIGILLFRKLRHRGVKTPIHEEEIK